MRIVYNAVLQQNKLPTHSLFVWKMSKHIHSFLFVWKNSKHIHSFLFCFLIFQVYKKQNFTHLNYYPIPKCVTCVERNVSVGNLCLRNKVFTYSDIILYTLSYHCLKLIHERNQPRIPIGFLVRNLLFVGLLKRHHSDWYHYTDTLYVSKQHMCYINGVE